MLVTNPFKHRHFTALWLLLAIFLLPRVASAQEYQAKAYSAAEPVPKYSSIVVSRLLQQLGLSLPDNDKNQPDKKTNNGDDFFDQDFFADDGQSFADIRKKMENTFVQTNEQWNKEYQETVARWEKARQDFLRQADQYDATTFDFNDTPKQSGESDKPAETGMLSLDNMQAGDFYIIPGALEIAIRNQAFRSTCAAFAGVRAIEVILNQNNIRKDFSEQQFYWMSKSDCQNQACPAKTPYQGSRFINGLYATQIFKVGLVSESDCPYVPIEDPTNETQTPLTKCYGRPGVRAKRMVADLPVENILSEIAANRPVMSGFTLTDNFSLGNGVVTTLDEGKYDNARNKHSGGHAVLLVGFIRLPESLQSEGRFCAITANSWGDGWGQGGYGCLSEKWMKKHSISHASLQAVELLSSKI